MKKIAIVIAVVFAVACTVLFSGQVFAALDGIVQSKDGKPIAGAQVILIFSQDSTKIELVTDDKGRWRKVNLQPGKWTIGFLAEGYEPENLSVELSAIKKNPTLEVRLNPLSNSLFARGDALYTEKKYEEALQEYKRMQESNPDLAQLYDKIGLCYYRLNDYENAIVNFRKMLEKDPQSQNTLINLSAIFFERGNLEEGMKYFQQLDEQALTDSSLFYNIGVLFFSRQDIDSALQYLSKSLEIDPKNVDALYQIGLANLNIGDMEKAKISLMRVIEIKPDSEKAVLARNLLSHIEKDPNRKVSEFEKMSKN